MTTRPTDDGRRDPNGAPTVRTVGRWANTYWVDPDQVGYPQEWAFGEDNEGQIVIYTNHYPARHCPECKCLWDDHQRPEEVDDGIPFARAASGETDPTQIVTCGDCAECTEVPPVEVKA